MFSLEIECDPDDRDLLIAELWEQGSAGIVELTPRRVRAFFEDGADRDELQAPLPRLRLPPGRAARLGAIGARSAAAHGSGRSFLPGAGVARRSRARRAASASW